MSTEIAANGAVTLTAVCARCDSCGHVRSGTQFTGPNGYVTLCTPCIAVLRNQGELKKAQILAEKFP